MVMARPSMSTRRKTLLFERHKGSCHICSGHIHVGEAWDLEHRIAWEISRDDSDANLAPAHKVCHAGKTRQDRKDIAKVHRVAAKHAGTFQKSKAKIPSRGFQKQWIWSTGNSSSGD